jgi:hypothetical protein
MALLSLNTWYLSVNICIIFIAAVIKIIQKWTIGMMAAADI